MYTKHKMMLKLSDPRVSQTSTGSIGVFTQIEVANGTAIRTPWWFDHLYQIIEWHWGWTSEQVHLSNPVAHGYYNLSWYLPEHSSAQRRLTYIFVYRRMSRTKKVCNLYASKAYFDVRLHMSGSWVSIITICLRCSKQECGNGSYN